VDLGANGEQTVGVVVAVEMGVLKQKSICCSGEGVHYIDKKVNINKKY